MIKAPRQNELEKHSYSAIIFQEGDFYIAEEYNGRKIKENDTDAATVFQAAINYSEGVISIREGTYQLSTEIDLKENRSLIGSGTNTILNSNANIHHIHMTNAGKNTIADLTLKDASSNQTNKYGLFIDSVYLVKVRNVLFDNGYHGILLQSEHNIDNTVRSCYFENLEIRTRNSGIIVKKNVHDNRFNNIFIDTGHAAKGIDYNQNGRTYGLSGGNTFDNISCVDCEQGILIKDCEQICFNNIIVDSCANNGLLIEGAVEELFFNNILSSTNTESGIKILGTSAAHIKRVIMDNFYTNQNGYYGLDISYTEYSKFEGTTYSDTLGSTSQSNLTGCDIDILAAL